MLYRALKEVQIRAEAAMDSEKVGRLPAGEEIEAIGRTTIAGTIRVQFDRGWVSVTSKQGKALLDLISGQEGADESSVSEDSDVEEGL